MNCTYSSIGIPYLKDKGAPLVQEVQTEFSFSPNLIIISVSQKVSYLHLNKVEYIFIFIFLLEF